MRTDIVLSRKNSNHYDSLRQVATGSLSTPSDKGSTVENAPGMAALPQETGESHTPTQRWIIEPRNSVVVHSGRSTFFNSAPATRKRSGPNNPMVTGNATHTRRSKRLKLRAQRCTDNEIQKPWNEMNENASYPTPSARVFDDDLLADSCCNCRRTLSAFGGTDDLPQCYSFSLETVNLNDIVPRNNRRKFCEIDWASYPKISDGTRPCSLLSRPPRAAEIGL